jgi:hypothetical protein
MAKMVNIYIPKEAVDSNEKTKKVFINDKMYSVPVGKNVEVPEQVAEVLLPWLENLSRMEEEREARMEELSKK